MNSTDKATLDSIEALIVADCVSVRKALETVYALGELEGQLKIARITENSIRQVFDPVLDIMSGKVKPS